MNWIFRHPPDQFVEAFMKFVYINQLKNDSDWGRSAEEVDRKLMVAIFYDFEKQALSFAGVTIYFIYF